MPNSTPPPSVRALAFTGFLLHAPGQWLLYRARPSRRAASLNVVVLVATVFAAALTWRVDGRPLAFAAVWLAGHLSWSALLVGLTLGGEVRIDAGTMTQRDEEGAG